MNPAIIQLAFTALMASADAFMKIREQARRNKVLTDEEDREFDRQMQEKLEQAHWKKSTDA